jgi:hypothetical protein
MFMNPKKRRRKRQGGKEWRGSRRGEMISRKHKSSPAFRI